MIRDEVVIDSSSNESDYDYRSHYYYGSDNDDNSDKNYKINSIAS
jgi:hypothetical protein